MTTNLQTAVEKFSDFFGFQKNLLTVTVHVCIIVGDTY